MQTLTELTNQLIVLSKSWKLTTKQKLACAESAVILRRLDQGDDVVLKVRNEKGQNPIPDIPTLIIRHEP